MCVYGLVINCCKCKKEYCNECGNCILCQECYLYYCNRCVNKLEQKNTDDICQDCDKKNGFIRFFSGIELTKDQIKL